MIASLPGRGPCTRLGEFFRLDQALDPLEQRHVAIADEEPDQEPEPTPARPAPRATRARCRSPGQRARQGERWRSRRSPALARASAENRPASGGESPAVTTKPPPRRPRPRGSPTAGKSTRGSRRSGARSPADYSPPRARRRAQGRRAVPRCPWCKRLAGATRPTPRCKFYGWTRECPMRSTLHPVVLPQGDGAGVAYRQRLVGVRHAASATGYTRLGNRHQIPVLFTRSARGSRALRHGGAARGAPAAAGVSREQ
jgi:hypothetical protein